MFYFPLNHAIFSVDPKTIKYLMLHCSATPRDRNITAENIRSWHKLRGFNDIGYHYVVRLDGTIEEGRNIGIPGAHCLGKNKCSISICYVGGVEKDGCTPADTRTEAQKEALKQLLANLIKIFPEAEICGHREFANKACPSFDARAEYSDFRRKVLTGAIATSALILPMVTGCRSHKTVEMDSDVGKHVEASTIRAHIIKRICELNDSVGLEVDCPKVKITVNDSVKAEITAQKVKTTHVSRADETAVVKTSRADTLTYTGHAEVSGREQRHVGSGNSVGWFVCGLGAVCLVAFILARIRRRRQSPRNH